MTNSPWWSKGLYFTCRGCGRCCRDEPGAVWVTDEERQKIATLLGITEHEFSEKYLWHRYGAASIRETANYDCIFLGCAGDRCMIYAARPAQCSLWPFWPSLLENELSWKIHAQKCPGMDSGEFFDESQIKRLLAQVPHAFI